MTKRKPIRRIQPYERLPMHHAHVVGGDKEVALLETQGGDFKIQTQEHEYPLDVDDDAIQKAQIRPEDIKRLSNLDEAGIRGGIHSKRTYLMALHDGSLWIWKQTGAEERDEIFVYELAQRMFRAIVPEVQPVFVPKLGWGSAMRKVAGVPAGRVDGLHGYFHGNDEMMADLASMLVLDYMTGNPDRHSNNWFIMHNDRLAAIDNGWAGEDLTMSFADVFQPARLAGMMEDERLWPQLLKGIAALIQDLGGRGDEVRALAEAIGIDKKEAVDMVRLWEPKLASLVKLIRSQTGKVEKEKVYIESGQQPPMGVRVEEGPRGGRYYESEGIPRGAHQTFREDPEEVAEWAKRHAAPEPEAEGERGVPDFNAFDGDVEALFKWASGEESSYEDLQGFFANVWQTDSADIEVTKVSVSDDRIEVRTVLRDPETGNQIGQMDRTFERADERVHHDVFIIDAAARGQGIALAINRQAEENYYAMGFQYVDLQADIDIGKYAWAQQGYNFSDEYEASSAMHNLIRFRWEENDSYWEDQEEAVEDTYQEEIADIDARWEGEEDVESWKDERAQANENRDARLSELNGLRHSEDPTDEFEQEMIANYDFTDAWDLAAMDDGESYSGMPLGKAFMISDYMREWSAYKNLDPDSTGARVGDIYYDKKKHKIKGKKRMTEPEAEEAQPQDVLHTRDVPQEWSEENLHPLVTNVAEQLRVLDEKAARMMDERRAAGESTGDIAGRAHTRRQEIIAEYRQRGREMIEEAGYTPFGDYVERAVRKAKGRRIPVELPKGFPLREGVTDEGAHDIDEDTDQEWRDALKELHFQGAIEKARTYVETPEQVPPGAQMETGPRGGTYYESEPQLPGLEETPEQRARKEIRPRTILDTGGDEEMQVAEMDAAEDEAVAKALEAQPEYKGYGKETPQVRGAVKDAITSRIAEATGLDYSIVKNYMRAWAGSSSDGDVYSLAMQVAAAQMFDLPTTPFIDESWKKVGGVLESVPYEVTTPAMTKHLPAAREILKVMYDDTQEYLKKQGIESLVLYRGMRWFDDAGENTTPDELLYYGETQELVPGLKRQEHKFHANPLSSWAYSFDDAQTFANLKPEGAEEVSEQDFENDEFLAEAEDLLHEEWIEAAEEQGVNALDNNAYENWKYKKLENYGNYDVGMWAYQEHDLAPPDIMPPVTRAMSVVEVPRQKIIATALTGLGCLEENEVVVTGGKFEQNTYVMRDYDGTNKFPLYSDIEEWEAEAGAKGQRRKKPKEEQPVLGEEEIKPGEIPEELLEQRLTQLRENPIMGTEATYSKMTELLFEWWTRKNEKWREAIKETYADKSLSDDERAAKDAPILLEQAKHTEDYKTRLEQAAESIGHESPYDPVKRDIERQYTGARIEALQQLVDGDIDAAEFTRQQADMYARSQAQDKLHEMGYDPMDKKLVKLQQKYMQAVAANKDYFKQGVSFEKVQAKLKRLKAAYEKKLAQFTKARPLSEGV